jgi:hypothetical protein
MGRDSLLQAHHFQREGRRLSAWFGFHLAHFVFGVALDFENRSVLVSLGPLYVGIGDLYDR